MAIIDWISTRRLELAPTVKVLPWAENKEWEFRDGKICHISGGFFSVVGLRVETTGNAPVESEHLMIDQPELGLLGFVISQTAAGFKWLLQAKSEPGTEGFVQVGPSVQATQSNYQRLHGGAETPFLDLFQDPHSPAVYDVPHSEQGSKFVGKFNRNALCEVPSEFEVHNPNWRWFESSDVKKALSQEFLLNTDSRSVIVCSPWQYLTAPHPPFSSESNQMSDLPGSRDHNVEKFVEYLRDSYRDRGDGIEKLVGNLRHAEKRERFKVQQTPINELAKWKIGESNICAVDEGADVEICSYSVEATGREVEAWHQPLLVGLIEHEAGLIFQFRDGSLKLYIRFCAEIGFGGRVEYGPSYQSDGENPAWTEKFLRENETAPILSVRQSDEGGRFKNSIMRYQIHHLSEDVPVEDDEDGVWVDLAQLEALCAISGTTTNELRSGISVLLSFA